MLQTARGDLVLAGHHCPSVVNAAKQISLQGGFASNLKQSRPLKEIMVTVFANRAVAAWNSICSCYGLRCFALLPRTIVPSTLYLFLLPKIQLTTHFLQPCTFFLFLFEY